MNKISTSALCFSFVGGFLGAGYISGQEVYQFFAAFGIKGIFGLFVAIALLAIFNLIIISIVQKTNDDRIDKTVVGSDNKILLFGVGLLETIIFFGTYVVMAAGAGALIEKVAGIHNSHIIGSLIFCIIISLLAIKGINGLVKIFSYAVPFLAILTVFVGVITFLNSHKTGINMTVSTKFNPLIPNWFMGAVTFAAYNLLCSIGVLCPIGLKAKSKKSALSGTLLGCIILSVIALSVILSISVTPGSANEELPMLKIAENLSPAFMYLYAFLLLIAMTGASLASLIPTANYLAQKSKICKKHIIPVVFITSAVSFLLSCFGFADLVGTVFASFGYISLIPVAGLIFHYFKLKKKH